MMKDLLEQSENYKRIEGAITFLEANYHQQPSLEEIAASVNLSKYHFQRLFKRWAGVSPTQFLHYLTVNYAKTRLRESRSVLDTSLSVGLSGPGRLHDLFVTYEAVTPGDYKHWGAGVHIAYGFHPTFFGECLVAVTPRGICALRFLSGNSQEDAIEELAQEWPRAELVFDPGLTQSLVDRLFVPLPFTPHGRFHLVLKGTNFQVRVWEALLAIPPGAMMSYQSVAEALGRPTASRAVANAIARNPVAYLIPCHRVINKNGQVHHYRWGSARKKAMLGWEASRGEHRK